MKKNLKTVAIIFLIFVASCFVTSAQINIPKSSILDELKQDQSIDYKLKHSLIKISDAKQSTNIDDGKLTQPEIKNNDNFYNDRVYIKFKTHNLSLTILNQENHKLFAKTFSNPNLDAGSQNYDINRIEQAFKINPKKYKGYLEKANVNTNENRNLNNIFVVYFNKPVDVLRFISELSKFENIEYIEPVPKYKYSAIPNDTYYSSQFYLDKIQAEPAWNIHKGENGDSTIIVGICDSGVEWMHSDLIDNLYQNLAEDADGDGHTIEYVLGEWVLDPGDLDGVDDDGNGYVDDLIGWNFYTADGTSENNPFATIFNLHGTHIAGISAGATNNSNGISSISWNVKFLPTKHADNTGGANVAYNTFDGVVYLAEFGADIINCSWGGDPFSEAEQELLDYVSGLGSIVITAAGNNDSNDPFYPASYHGVISVASVAETDAKAYYSNYSPYVDISAPGGDGYVDAMILSTIPGDGYASFQGTSASSPLVAGLTALIKSYKPTYSNSKIIELLLANADNIESENTSYSKLLGYGRINAYNSLKNLDATLSKALKVNLVKGETISKTNLMRRGDTVKIVYKFSNNNPLYGSKTTAYSLSSIDDNITILSGQKDVPIEVGVDSDFIIDTLLFKINEDAELGPSGVQLVFTNDEGFFADSIYYTNFNIIEVPTVRAYVSYGNGGDSLGPVKFKLDDAEKLTWLTKDMYPTIVKASTWAFGKWYCVEDDNDIVTFDTTSGARTYIGNLGVGINGLAFDSQTNLIWGVGDNNGGTDGLYIIDPIKATARLLYQKSYGLEYINLAANGNGDLYSIDIANDLLIYINKWTGNAYQIMQLPDDFVYAQDMDYDKNSGLIFLATYNASRESSISYIDFNDNQIRKVSEIQNKDEITGLVFPNNDPPVYPVQLISPSFGDTIRNNITFKWKHYDGTVQYLLYVSNYPNFSTYDSYATTDTSIVLRANHIGLGPVYWEIVAVDADYNYSFSGQWVFENEDQFCNSFNTTCDERISNFEFGLYSHSSDCGLYKGYSDYSYEIIDAYKGKTYYVKITNPTPYSSDLSAVWIDFNSNNSFDDNEMTPLQSNDGGNTFEGAISIPAEADTGLYRLRARIVYDDSPRPCGFSNYGETEDYTINIEEYHPVPTSWAFIETVDNSTIIDYKTGANSFCDRAIATGDAIGVFYKDGTTEKCAGYSYWEDGENMAITAWGDDDMTDEKDGFEANETYTIKMWDAALEKEYRAKGTLKSGKEYFTNNGITEYSSIDAVCTETHTIPLPKGWNMISTYVQPPNDSIAVILKPIISNFVIAKNGAGQMYYPTAGINLIKKWGVQKGYLIYMKASDTLDITGMVLPTDTVINLPKGWNMIAYTRKSAQSIVTALADIVSNFVLIKNGAGLIYYPAASINLIGDIKTGQGYLIYMKVADTLDYPGSNGKRNVDKLMGQATHLLTKTSPMNMNVIIETNLPNNWEIGAYNASDELVGSGLVENVNAAVTIFADDENTSETDGAKTDEAITFKAYNPDNDVYESFDLTEISDIVSEKSVPSVKYLTNALLTAKAKTEIKAGNDYRITLSPNPAQNQVELLINLSSTTTGDIKVYDLHGKELYTVFTGNLPQGETKLQINCESLPNGTYNVVIQMKDRSITKRFAVVR